MRNHEMGAIPVQTAEVLSLARRCLGGSARTACTALLALGLVACAGGGSMHDLHTYVKHVLARKGGQVPPLPEVKPYEMYAYQSDKKRNPFEPFFQETDSSTGTKAAAANGIHPDFNRNKEELEQFPLDSLRMVGTLEEKHTMFGLVRSPDGILHRVQLGNYMGKNYGKITNILQDRIDVQEIVPNGQGGWEKNHASLALVEK